MTNFYLTMTAPGSIELDEMIAAFGGRSKIDLGELRQPADRDGFLDAVCFRWFAVQLLIYEGG